MDTLVIVAASLAGLIHIGFWVMESLLWRRPAVHRIFGVRDLDTAADRQLDDFKTDLALEFTPGDVVGVRRTGQLRREGADKAADKAAEAADAAGEAVKNAGEKLKEKSGN